MSGKKVENVHIPEGYIRVHGVNLEMNTAIVIANGIKEQLIHYHQDPKYSSGKGRDYIRTLEDKVECIFREVRKIKEKNEK